MRVVHHHSLDLISDSGVLDRRPHAPGREVAGPLPHVGDGGGDWQHRARRAEAEASAARMEASATKVLTHAELWAVGEELRMTQGERELADHRAAALAAAGLFGARRSDRLEAQPPPRSARSTLLARDGRVATPPADLGEPLGDAEGARGAHRAQQLLLAGDPERRSVSSRSRFSRKRRDQVRDPVGLEAGEDRVAVERVEDL